MAKRLFVAGLSWGTTDDSLKNLFSGAGSVASANVVVDRMTGKSRGFGFVEMSTDEESDKAINMFNNTQFDGRTITVNVARPKEDRPGGFNRNDRGGYRN